MTLPLVNGTRTAVDLATPDALRVFGDRPALYDGSWVSYAELADMVSRNVCLLGPEPTVVAVPERRDAATVAWIAAALGGGHVLLMHDERGDEILRTYQPAHRVRDGRLSHTGAPTPVHPELSLLLTTSGTTGSPKLVRLSAEGIDANAQAIAQYLELCPDDRTITTLPLSYCFGLSLLTSHLRVGAGVVLTDLSVVDDCFWDLAASTGVSTLAGVPYTFDLLQRAGFQGRETLPTVRRVLQAGGRLAPERVRHVAHLAQRQAWDFYVMYGQTEATARMAYLPPQYAAEHPDCVGVAVPGCSLRIDDGEVVFRGPNVMMGYAHGPADLIRGREITELRTGDLGELTDDGLLRLTGRVANRAKIFGQRIDLDHVERMVPGSAALVMEDTLVLAVDGPPDGLGARIARQTGLPEGAVHVQSLRIPRLPSGKTDRQRLMAMIHLHEDSVGPDLAAGVRHALRSTLRRNVSDDDSFVSLGGDSLSYVAASVRLERVLGDLPRRWHLMSVRELVQTAAPNSATRWARTETSMVLRAVAILLVVASHAGLIDVRGGAHLLLGLAGVSFARFLLPGDEPLHRVREALTGFLVPVGVWLALVVATSQEYGLSVFGVTFRDLPGDHPAWRYWFVEVLAMALLLAGAIVAPARLRRLERTSPVLFAGAVLAVALLARELLTPPSLPGSLFTPAASLWVFALGWLLGVIGGHRTARIAASLLVLVLVVPSFDNPTRDVVVALGLLLVLWLPDLRLPSPVVALVSAVAGASLVIFLTHWQLYPPFGQWPTVATAVAVSGGVVFHLGLRRAGLMR